MRAMSDGEVQVLVCTTIIETIDIPNVNTLIIETLTSGLAQPIDCDASAAARRAPTSPTDAEGAVGGRHEAPVRYARVHRFRAVPDRPA